MAATEYSAPLGYAQVTSPGTFDLTASIPSGANLAVVILEGATARWRDDGTNPTATVGMPIPAGATLEYGGQLPRLKFFMPSGGTLNVSFYATQ